MREDLKQILEVLSEAEDRGFKASYLTYRLSGLREDGRKLRTPNGQSLTQKLLKLQEMSLIEKINSSPPHYWKLTNLGRREINEN